MYPSPFKLYLNELYKFFKLKKKINEGFYWNFKGDNPGKKTPKSINNFPKPNIFSNNYIIIIILNN